MKKKVLIIGNSSKEYALAKVLSKNCEVYVAPGNDAMREFAEVLDIRENAVTELLEYVMENGIDLTIPVSLSSINTDIVNIFNNNQQPIFAPSLEAASIILDKASAKKFLYKLRVPTPKFGIFEKQSMVNDYIKNLKAPFVIKTNEPSSAVIFTSPKSAKSIVDSLYSKSGQKVIIEDYVYGMPFTLYVITDGYKALPIGSSILYKHSLEGEGGQLTSGMGACSPNYKLSENNENYIINKVVYPLLNYFDNGGNPYIGILGVSGVISDGGEIQILGFNNFMQDSDCDGILNLLDVDLMQLFESCVIGSFSDEFDYIPQKDLSAVSLVLACRNKETKENTITGIDNLDEGIQIAYNNNVKKNKYLEFEANEGAAVVLTALARTAGAAAGKIYEEADSVDFRGKTYRKDICKPLNIDL